MYRRVGRCHNPESDGQQDLDHTIVPGREQIGRKENQLKRVYPSIFLSYSHSALIKSSLHISNPHAIVEGPEMNYEHE